MQEEQNLRQQLRRSRIYVYCHLYSHIWKATLLPRGEKSFCNSLGREENTSPARCWLSSQRQFVFLHLCHPPQRTDRACDWFSSLPEFNAVPQPLCASGFSPVAESITFCMCIWGLLFQINGSYCCCLQECAIHHPHPATGQGMAQSPSYRRAKSPSEGCDWSRLVWGWTQTRRTRPWLENTNLPARGCLGREKGAKGRIKRRSNTFFFWYLHLKTKMAV